MVRRSKIECRRHGSENVSVVFIQAEDGIRDLVRSRGLGDVYKRQNRILAQDERHSDKEERLFCIGKVKKEIATVRFTAVSYTHLTLTTSDLV